MNLVFSKSFKFRSGLYATLLLLALTIQSFAQAPAPAASGISLAESALAANIRIETIKEVTKDLSAPEMEGRGTMQPGGDKAANYIADRFKKLGFKPLGDKGSYLQNIDFKERVYTDETSFQLGEEKLVHGDDYGFLPFTTDDKSASGDMVFIAYGLQAKQVNRDDLAGINPVGKIVVMLDGPPANIPKAAWEKGNIKFQIIGSLIRQGVRGIIFIAHGREKDPNEMIISYVSRRDISPEGDAGPSLPPGLPPILMASNKAAEKFFAKSSATLKDALAQAENSSFKPIVLNQKAKIISKSKTTKGSSNNVVAYMEGSDPMLKAEAVLFSGHYDAYGLENGKTYHGAADNALGVAELFAVAEAFSKAAEKPKRSLIFIAVTGEEYGLHGSKYWAKKPTWDIKKVAANLNLDGVGTEIYGPVKTMVGYGAEHSSMGAMLLDVAKAMNLDVIPDPFPDEKVFYRSDHYSFVEKGVPSLMLLGAPAGDKELWIKRMKDWEKTDYHQPGDTIKDNWAWEGAKTVADVMGIMGLRIANGEQMPSWLSTSRFAKLERGNTKEIPEEK